MQAPQSLAGIEAPLLRFIEALRSAGLQLSVAESIDAFDAVAVTGFADRHVLKDALALVLAKSESEKAIFADCFDRFFARETLDLGTADTALPPAPEGIEAGSSLG
ncbi:MAG TPA: hypothetical protein VMA53_01235, partial [Stellaceae bacterium]|nr:hypothetical protein [Stellaceae bacterium]